MASRSASDMVPLQSCHGVAFCTILQFQGFAVVDSLLSFGNWLFMSRIWFAAEALILNQPSRRQAGPPLLKAEFDRRARDERQRAFVDLTPAGCGVTSVTTLMHLLFQTSELIV